MSLDEKDQTICEECGKPLTLDQQDQNERIYQNVKIHGGSRMTKLNYCNSCWNDYCHHAETGD